MSESRYTLHWVTIIVDVFELVKVSFLPFILVIFANGRNFNDSNNWFLANWSNLFISALLVFMLVSSIIKWKRFEYWFEDDELRIESGLFVKKKRYIPFDRIQSLDNTEGIFHRPFKLVKVKVETAGGASPVKAELTAITKEAAKRVEFEMIEAKKRKKALLISDDHTLNASVEEIGSSARPVFSMTTKDLLILATTSGGIGLIFSGIAVFLSQFADVIPFERMYDELSQFIAYGLVIVVIAVFIGLLVVWGISVAMTYFSYYGFTVVLDKEDIVITKGLLEKKSATIPLNRVQAVRIIENPFRQAFGYANVVIENAGGGIDDGATINLFPLIKKSMIAEPLMEIFPGLMSEQLTGKLPNRSKRFYYRLHFVWMLPVIGVVTYFLYPYGLLSMLVMPPVVYFGLWRHRSGSYEVSGNKLVLRFRRFSLNTAYLMKNKIQSMQIKQNYFQQRKGVATISARVKSGAKAFNAELKHMEQVEAERLLAWYKPRGTAD